MKKIIIALAFALLLLGCASQTERPGASAGTTENVTENKTVETGGVDLKAEKGDLVAVDYLGTLENGTVFDTSIREEAVKANLPLRPEYAPLEFTVGAGQMIAGFDSAVVGMEEGNEKTVTLKPEDAYGEVNPEYVVDIPKANVPPEVKEGSQLMASNGMAGTVVEVGNESVKIDFNHPLAGKALTFKIIMRKITKG